MGPYLLRGCADSEIKQNGPGRSSLAVDRNFVDEVERHLPELAPELRTGVYLAATLRCVRLLIFMNDFMVALRPGAELFRIM